MSSKVQRKVTVENVKDSTDAPRRPSVFERLGPGAVGTQERHSRSSDPGEKCRNWMRSGICSYGSKCRYQHEAYPPSSSSSSSKVQKGEREPSQKDLRHKVRHKQQDGRESRSRSPSPKKRKLSSGGGSNSRTRRLDNESKIKSTVVVTRPRTPSSEDEEVRPAKEAKPPKNWEGASDDWPLDEASLDYKEELSLEMKRQQLQRELEMLQKENRPGAGGSANSSNLPASGHVTITKTVRAAHPAPASFSGSSESSSDSDSSSSDSSTSSSDDDDSDDSSSSSSSGEASPVAVRTGSNAGAPATSPSDRGRYRHRGAGDDRVVSRRGAPDPPSSTSSVSRSRDVPRSGASYSRGDHRDASRHGRERQGAGRETGEGRSPPPRRRQDPEYDSYGRSRGPRTPSPGAVSDAKRKASMAKPPVPMAQPKPRKKKKSSKRRRERERQMKGQHRTAPRAAGQPEPPGRDSVSPDLLPPVSSSRSRHAPRDVPRRSREREPPGRGQGSTEVSRHGPPRGRSPGGLPAHDSMTPPHLHRSGGDKYGAPPSKRQRRDSPSLVEPPPREPRKKESERHGREEHGSHPRGSYEPRYSGEAEGRGHQSSRKRDDGYAEPPLPPHRHRHEPVDDDALEPGEVMPEQSDRYGGDRGCHEGGRSRDSRRPDYHHSRSTSPSMGGASRGRLDVDMHRMSDYPHSPQGGRSRGPDLPKSKGDQRGPDMRRDPYPHPPDGRGDSYRRVDSRSDPHKGDPRSDGRADYHDRGGPRSDYHGRMDPKSDYHRGDPYGKGGDVRPDREPRGDPYGRGDMRGGDPYRPPDYRHDRGDHRMDMRCKEPPPRMERDMPYEPRQDGYGRADDYYGRPPDPKMDRGRDYYGDGYGGHRLEPRDRGSRDGRRPEHMSRSEPHPKGNVRMERDRRSDTRGGERSRGESDGRPDGRPDTRPPGYGSKSDHVDPRGRGDPRGEDMRDPYERGDGYRGERPEPHRSSDLRGDPGRRDHKRPSRSDPAPEEPSSGRYGRRDDDAREREPRAANRDSRGAVCSRSSSPARSYERKRVAHKDRPPREAIKREDEPSTREADVKEDRSSNGSRGSSPGRSQEKAAARSTREGASERREQSPDTSIPEAAAPKVEAASPLTEDSEEGSPAKGEVSDSSKHMVLVEECKSDDENDNGQEQKAAASESFSDWSDDEDDLLTKDDPSLEFLVREMSSSDSHTDQVSQDRLEEVADTNLIEVDAVPISPADSRHSGEGGLCGAEEFDPISDDELEALIDESKDKGQDDEKSNVLDIDWSSLVKDAHPKDESATKLSSARERYSAARVLARIGISKDLAGEALTQRVVEFCRKELGGELSSEDTKPEFKLEDLTAGFHVAAVSARKHQNQALQCCSRYSRALSARRDLLLRRSICKVYEHSTTTTAAAVNPGLFKRSLQIFQSHVGMEVSQKC